MFRIKSYLDKVVRTGNMITICKKNIYTLYIMFM